MSKKKGKKSGIGLKISLITMIAMLCLGERSRGKE